LSLIFDSIALFLSLFDLVFALMVFVYGLVSKAYSHPAIRLKSYPYLSWFVVAVFQGGYTFAMVWQGLGLEFYDEAIAIPSLISSLLLAGSYPFTQIYQHKEDSKRGDRTISLVVGKLGTFYLGALFFGLSFIGFYWLFTNEQQIDLFWVMQIVLSPVLIFVLVWYLRVYKDPEQADFQHTMRLNLLSSLCLIAFMLYWLLRS
jgi:1,4-dihydroxy-2-naphthoate octaprenyltransferase